MTNSSKSPPQRNGPSNTQDAIGLLRADHELMSVLFAEYDKARSTPKKMELVSQICAELTVHAQVEEEIFYPAVKQALKDKELIPEATVEHASLKDLISHVKDVQPDGEMFNARIKVLSEYVKHHVKEEEDEMFPKVKATRLDLVELGARMAGRKLELVAQRA